MLKYFGIVLLTLFLLTSCGGKNTSSTPDSDESLESTDSGYNNTFIENPIREDAQSNNSF